jgi:hypothetical protein
MEFWLSGSLSRTFFFFMMEFWLSGSLSHELFSFSRWNSGYQEAFHELFSFSRWNSGYQEAFHELFSFSRWNSGYQEAFHELISFSRWNSGYQEAFLTNFFLFHDGILEIRNLGEDSFYTYITKSIHIGSASLKTLPLDLEPPLQGKEYGPPYSHATREVKAILHLARTCFFPKSLIDTCVDVKSAPYAKHTARRTSWLHTQEDSKTCSQFSLKINKRQSS